MASTTVSSETADSETEIFLQKFEGMHYGGQLAVDLYSSWSDVYEQNMLNMTGGYKHPEAIADIAAAVLKDKTCNILDVCAGTGLGGAALAKRGFVNIDALDGSSGMLDKARQKGVYKNVFIEVIGTETLSSLKSGSYDAVVTSGSFVPGHLGPRQLRVLAETLTPGGHFCMAMREAYLETEYLQDLEPEMQRMQTDGVWRVLSTDRWANYHNGLPGRVFVCQKC